MVARKFTASEEELREVYGDTLSMKKTADYFGVSKKLILNYMKKFGIGRRDWDASDKVETIREMVADGKESREIAETLDITQVYVRQLCKKHDVPLIDSYHKGYTISHNGYRMIVAPKDHPHANSNGYIREQRLVVEAALGRYLSEDEVVHHIDGDKLNNALDNLEVMSRSEHMLHHLHNGDIPPRGPDLYPRKKPTKI